MKLHKRMSISSWFWCNFLLVMVFIGILFVIGPFVGPSLFIPGFAMRMLYIGYVLTNVFLFSMSVEFRGAKESGAEENASYSVSKLYRFCGVAVRESRFERVKSVYWKDYTIEPTEPGVSTTLHIILPDSRVVQLTNFWDVFVFDVDRESIVSFRQQLVRGLSQ